MEQITNSAINERAVKIAARIMQAAGLCSFDNPMKCRKTWPPSPWQCTECIKRWLLGKAKKELELEQEAKRQ